MQLVNNEMQFEVLHLFCGSGGAAEGMQRSLKTYKGLTGRYITICGIDNDPVACRNFERLTGSKAECMDLFPREDYIIFHEKEPPADWHEVTPEDIRRACKGRKPDIIFLSPPCKGFSGLLPAKLAKSPKYQALNRLVSRSVKLVMEAFADEPPAIVMMENVPRIKDRGLHLLIQAKKELEFYGFIVHDKGIHDCGEWGGLGQHRDRYLLIARNPKKIPSFIYQPVKQRVKSIGEILENLPMPGDTKTAGKMHKIPNLTLKNWIRLWAIPAGKDWRAAQHLFTTTYRNGTFMITPWEKPSNTVTSSTRGVGQSNGVSAVQEKRIPGYANLYRVVHINEPSPVVTGGTGPSNGALSVADLKFKERKGKWPGTYKIEFIDGPAPTVTGQKQMQKGAICIADVMFKDGKVNYSKSYKVSDVNEPAPTVTCDTDIQQGAICVSDIKFNKGGRSGNYGVNGWDNAMKTVSASLSIDNGVAAVADPRIPRLNERCVIVLIAEDGTWHRPLTTFELAMLQSFPTHFKDGKPLEFEGSDEKCREQIGNAVPPLTACDMGNALLDTLIPNYLGEWHWGFSDDKIWVFPDISVPDELLIN